VSEPGSSDVHVDGVDWKGKKPKKKESAVGEFAITTKICKVDDSLGLVMGFAIVCKQDGEDYFDVQDDHIPEDAMLGAAVDFMQNSRVAKEMHAGDSKGAVLFAFPLTTEIAKSFGIETKTTGLMIAMKPDNADMLAKFKSGELTGFSIGGRRITDEAVA
jgi:putative serine protease XkdF